METPNFNNQPENKSPKEKVPEVKFLNIEGVGDFEYKESYVEFPEYLIEETGGVKGYVRKQFDSMEDIKEKIKRSIQDTSLEEIEDFFIKTNRKYEMFEGGYRGDYSKKKNIDDIRERFVYFKTAESINKLYDIVTDNEFPRNTSLNFFTGVHLANSDQALSHLKEDKLFLQKIFGNQRFHHKRIKGYSQVSFVDTRNKTIELDINRISSNKYYNLQKKDGDQEGIDLREFFVEKPSKRNFIKNKELVDKFKETELHKVQGFMEKYDGLFERVDDKEDGLSLFMLGIAGLHCQNKDASGDDGLGWGSASRIIDTVFSGFSIKNKAFKEYLEKVKIVLETLPVETIKKEPSEISLGTIDYFLQSRDHTDIHTDHLEHPAIPIIQGYPNIPDLRWCHASYMSIPTKNGLNILEFIT